MSYIPSPEKWEALGFSESGHLRWVHGLRGFEGIATADVLPGGSLRLYQARGYNAWNRDLFWGQCPSEEFFDQLLVAIGWGNQ
jgi:hypothetical protein